MDGLLTAERTAAIRAAFAPRFSADATAEAPEPVGASAAFLAAALRAAFDSTVLWIAESQRALDAMHQDVLSLFPELAGQALFYPEWETLPGEDMEPDVSTSGHRLRALCALAEAPRPLLVCCSVHAAMQPAVPPAALRKRTIRLAAGARHDPAELLAALQSAGYEIGCEAAAKGQVAARGGIVDVWPVSEERPVRLDFFGDAVETARAYDPATQRSEAAVGTVLVPPAAEARIIRAGGAGALTDYLPAGAIVVWGSFEGIRAHAEAMEREPGAGSPGAPFASLAALERAAGGVPGVRQLRLSALSARDDAAAIDFAPVGGLADRRAADAILRDAAEQARNELIASLVQARAAGAGVHLFMDTAGSRDRFLESHPGPARGPRLDIRVGAISRGFRSDALRLAVVAESDLFGRKLLTSRYEPASGRAPAAAAAGARLESWADIDPGDFVVHVQHGIGRYLGLFEIAVDGRKQEVLSIEYAEGAKLHVPVSQAHLLSRYVGLPGHACSPHKLGAARWQNDRAMAEKGVRDMAAAMLEVQAARSALAGHAFAPDCAWQREFEAGFAFRETADQERAIAEVKRDMESRRPMDRLICGDVGFGKTEVAMRAAFKAVMDGRQVAVLVPTTVLAQQHFETFRERMAAFPVRVEMLSRFLTRGQRRGVVRALLSCAADIVVGTHALLDPEVRFRDLGLVVVDEEQRFGVQHKEWLKQVRRLVDVLTLTATPIPRTLYMSLMGTRELCTMQTPPRERIPVETIVAPNTDEVVRRAILRELQRDGQAYYLHNRILSIDRVRARLAAAVPEARIDVGHGRMSSAELAEVMHRFVRGETNVLLCTTIIESGVDIPNANTILIDRADRFGLADLYQLRGRVGRSARKGYAYLLLPPHGEVDAVARRRLATIRQYTRLGSGYSLALRDLELRGAGNLLGTQQSGHIAAVGFLLYCQLLRRTIARMKGEEPDPVADVRLRLDFIDLSPEAAGAPNAALIPAAYIEDEKLRVEAYRRIAEIARPEQAASARAEFRDRFGAPPPECERLLRMAELRARAAARGITSIETASAKVIMKRGGDFVMEGERFPRLKPGPPDAMISELERLADRA